MPDDPTPKAADPGPGANPTPAGAQPGVSREDLDKAIAGAFAPISETLAQLQKSVNAQRRIDDKAAAAPEPKAPATAPGTESTAQNGNSEATAAMRRELKALQNAEAQRVEREQQARIRTELKARIAAGPAGDGTTKFSRPGILEELLLPGLKVGETGAVISDDGTTVKTLEQIVADRGKEDAFQPAAAGTPSGAPATAGEIVVPNLPRDASPEATKKAIWDLSKKDFDKLAHDLTTKPLPR